MSEKFQRGSVVTNINGDEFNCKIIILVTGDRSTSDNHFSGVCVQSYNQKIHPMGDFSTTWHLGKFVKSFDSFEEWQKQSPAEQPVREMDAEELWDEHSALIGEDLDDLSYWSGRDVMKKEDFFKALQQFKEQKEK